MTELWAVIGKEDQTSIAFALTRWSFIFTQESLDFHTAIEKLQFLTI